MFFVLSVIVFPLDLRIIKISGLYLLIFDVLLFFLRSRWHDWLLVSDSVPNIYPRPCPRNNCDILLIDNCLFSYYWFDPSSLGIGYTDALVC